MQPPDDVRRRTIAVTFTFLMVLSTATAGLAFGVAGVFAQEETPALYRVNAGSGTVAATDGGTDWTPPGSTTGVSLSGGTTYSASASVSLGSSVPAGTPTDLFTSEIYGDQQWTFDDGIQSGTPYEVRLYFAEIYHVDGHADNDDGGDGQVGDRVFDVSVQGETVLDGYDIYADIGAETAVMKSFTVTPTDGTIAVGLTTVTDNAKVSAIEIVPAEPEPDTLGGPSAVDFGSVLTGDSEAKTVTVTNLGGSGDPSIDVSGVSVTGPDADEFAAGGPSQGSLAPGESATIPVTFIPADAQAKSATLEVSHSGSNSPLTVALSGEGASSAQVGFGKSGLQGFGQGSLTALEFGPDGRLYVAQQDGDVYALEVTRDGENSYDVVSQESVDAIKDIPNHDDNGNYVSGENTRQVTGLTVGGTAETPVVYVSSSDPTIDVGTDDDDTDTNSGAISRLTFDWNGDGSLNGVDHEVLVLGLPRSEENHATNGMDLSDDGTTLFVAQGGHTNQGAPSNNFGHTSEYALSAAVLSVDLQQIDQNYQPKNLQDYDSAYPDVEFLYAIPTIQTDDATDGDDLPFGGDDGVNQAKWVEDGPVQVHSSGYRNPYDLVLTEDDRLYTIDNGPNGGWGGQPIGEGSGGVCTNEPNDPGSGDGDQLHLASEGSYGGHPAPIRGNPTGADIYDAAGNLVYDITESNSPVPASKVNPIECDYQGANEDNSLGDEFGWTGGIEEYTASNFGGQMQGDLLVVVGSSSVTRVELTADGTGVTEQSGNFFSDLSALGIAAQGDDGPFPGTVWTARGGITVFEPTDYEGSGGGGNQCTAADDVALDEDEDGYDNADELDAGTDPCSAASTPADFDGDGTSNVNDADDDDDGTPDTADPFALDADDGTSTSLPVTMDLSETQLFGPNGQGWTGLMTNGQDDYLDLYDPDQMTVGGAAQVLTVENVPSGDAVNDQNAQQFAFQRGVDAPDQPFTVSTTVNGFPADPQNYQGLGIYVGNGDQDNYLKLILSAEGGDGGIQFAKEVDGSFGEYDQHVTDGSVTGPSSNTDLSLTVFPSNETVKAYYTPPGGEKTYVGETTVPSSWLDSADGSGLAVGVVATSYNAGSTFDATWTDLVVEYVTPPANQPPVADAGADVTVEEGQQVTLDASGSSDPNADTLGFTWSQLDGPDAGLDFFDSESVSFTAPDVDGDQTLTFQVSVSDGEFSDTDTVTVTVEDADGEPADGTVVHRVNVGGPELAATDDGPVWSADTSGSPSPYLVAGGSIPGGLPYAVGGVDASVSSDTPTAVFGTERYDPDSGDEMLWSFSAQSGTTYEARLYFHDGYSGTSDPGDRVFDVSVEGQQVLTDFDPIVAYGDNTGGMESFTVTPTDDSVDVELLHGLAENPQINAIEIVAVGDDGPGPVGEFTSPPTDTDGDGVYEDVNGDGSFDVGDVQAFFQNYEGSTVQDNVDAFDVNGDGSVNVGDVQALFQEATSS
ncbi:malectin domain-containing carbohydrate-binding protein [Halomarina salina]|uniref:Malectin domain-containing carbohydrate-binding protein n=1 Tax=Halomarina salina TaxID=1872699 RepID=A0ABD5RIL5_9EURY|nr:malectin domain-containing carbohydrate-binding protein [Halomarina salina]